MRFISIRKRHIQHWFVVVLVALVVGTAVPHSAFAQTGQEGGGGVWGWVSDGFNTVVNNGVGFFVELGNQLGWPNTSGPTAVSDVTSNATNGIINTSVDAIVTTGNQLWWPSSSGPTVISNIVDTVIVNPIVDLMVNLYNNDPDNTYYGEPAGGNATEGGGPVPSASNGSNSNSDSNSGSNSSNDTTPDTATDAPGGGNTGPSIPGASVGTAGNPFSDGTDSTDAPSNNDDISPFANPYLFEYDPNSTNNNPSGGEAQSQ